MNVTVRGILHFQHRAALEKGILAFDEHAYPEFFQSELWRLSGPYAICENEFEIEVDCDHLRSFFEMAKYAVDGAIDLREKRGDGTFVRVMRKPRPGKGWTHVKLEPKWAEFGAKFADYATEWRPLIKAANAEEAVAAAKEKKAAALRAKATKKQATDGKKRSSAGLERAKATKGPGGAKRTVATAVGKRDAAKSATTAKAGGSSVAVTFAGHPSDVVELPDGSLAVAVDSKVVFVAPSGARIGDVECVLKQYDQFSEIHGLTVLGDGRVVAFNKQSSEIRIARAGDDRATAFALPDKVATSIQDVIAGEDRLYLVTHESVVVVDLAKGTVVKELRPRKKDFLARVLVHGDSLVVSTRSETAVFDRKNTCRFVVKGALVESTSDEILVHHEDKAAVLMGMNGKKRCRFEAGSVTPGRDNSGRGPRGPWAIVEDAVYVASRWPRTVTRWSLVTGEQVWRAAPTHEVFPGGCIATDSYVAYWAPPQFHVGAFDSGIAVLDPKTGKSLARLDAKVPIIDVVPFGDDAVAAFADGRTAGSKLLVWRNITTKPRAEVLGGHKGRIAGLRRLTDGRLVSWAGDKSIRFWS